MMRVQVDLAAFLPPLPPNIDRDSITKHPSFCATCANLEYACALQLYTPLQSYLGLHTVEKGASIKASLSAVESAARARCASCAVLRACVITAIGEEAWSTRVDACKGANKPEGLMAWSDFDQDDEDEDEQEDPSLNVTFCRGKLLSIIVELPGDAHTCKRTLKLDVFTKLGEGCPFPSIGNEICHLDTERETCPLLGGSASLVNETPTSKDALQKVKSWIKSCDNGHTYCRACSSAQNTSGQALVYPKRLLFVGTNDSDICLEETKRAHQCYVALSYCWGKTVGLRLSNTNIEELQSGIKRDSLLPVHRDAITLTRLLGYEYLWIDALCIIQDNDEDKLDELGRMSDIYTNANLTIAAMASDDAKNSILTPRQATDEVEIKELSGQSSRIYVRERLPHGLFDWTSVDMTSPAIRQNRVDTETGPSAPLLTRGWTFQERLLSPRILHIAAHELIWECLGSLSCECGSLDSYIGTRGLPERRWAAGVPSDIEVQLGQTARADRLAERLGVRGYGRMMDFIPAAMRVDPAFQLAVYGPERYSPPEDNVFDRWRELIAQYSRRELSYRSDTLPAVAGLAVVMAKQGDVVGRYLAGMWEESLLRDMMWHSVEPPNVLRPAVTIAPTWSWASVGRAVDWWPADRGQNYHVELREAKCDLKKDFKFGEVGAGSVQVKGPLVACTLTVTKIGAIDDPEHQGWATIGDITRPVVLDTALSKEDQASAIFCLWWCTDVNDEQSGRGFSRGMVLAQDNRQRDPVYRRLGLIKHFPHDEWESLCQATDITIV